MPILLTVGWIAYLIFPEPYYDASKYQFLVGKTIEEVQRNIGHRRSRVSGYQSRVTPSGERIERGFEVYNGMEIYYDSDKVVVEVRDTK